jgi:hypothetical protein
LQTAGGILRAAGPDRRQEEIAVNTVRKILAA